jgi:hypothetical protein
VRLFGVVIGGLGLAAVVSEAARQARGERGRLPSE